VAFVPGCEGFLGLTGFAPALPQLLAQNSFATFLARLILSIGSPVQTLDDDASFFYQDNYPFCPRKNADSSLGDSPGPQIKVQGSSATLCLQITPDISNLKDFLCLAKML
jgi:hypothetical protein